MTTGRNSGDEWHCEGNGRCAKLGGCRSRLKRKSVHAFYRVSEVGKPITSFYTNIMHEMAVTQSILDIAVEHAERSGAGRVTALNLVIGQLSSIVDDSVQFYWDIISKDTLCEGAVLNFERVPAQMVCVDCGHSYTLSRGLEACPECGSFRVRIAAGDEFRLESFEVEEVGQVIR